MNWAQKAITGVSLSVALMTPTITSAAAAGASNRSAGNPMIIRNPDGTFTIQKKPLNRTSKDSKAVSGLVIPPQVVVPLVPATGKKP